MSKKAVLGVVALLTALSVGSVIFAQAPKKPAGNLPGTFTFVPKADVEQVQKNIESGTTNNDAPVRTVNISNRYNLGVYTLNSKPTGPAKAGAPVNGFYHTDIAEVYYIVSGNGTWRVGGELENPQVDDPTARSVKEVRGPGVVGVLKGYTNQKIATGDVLILPPGVPHSPGEMFETTKIVRIVIDPHKIMPLHSAVGQTTPATGRPSPAAAKPAPKLEGTWTFIPKADIDKVLKEEETPGTYGDRAVRTVDLPAINFRVGVYVLHGTKMSDRVATAGWYHTNIAEIYTFMRGAGSFMIGGSLENPSEDAADSYSTKMVRGPSVSGNFKGVTEQKMATGDWLIAPTGVPHVPGRVTAAPRDILRIALDPDKVLPLK